MPDIDHRLLFEASPEVLLVLLPDAPRYTMVAATDARLLATHTSREQVIGRSLFDLFPDNPDDATASGTRNLRASLDRVVATRAPDTMAVQKYDIRGPDGAYQVKHWSPKNLPVLSPTGELLYILHRVEDVTDLVRASAQGEELRGRTRDMELEVLRRSRELDAANRQLRDANTRLGELDAAKTDFFSNVSHEFRTPLTLMLGPLEDSLSDTASALPPAHRARVALARDNALRLHKLVNGLLDFSRIEAGRLRGAFAPLDVSTFTAELAGMFQSAFDSAGVRLLLDCPPLSELPFVDRELWERIVPNLLSNAFKFTLQGEVAVRVRELPEHVALEVADTGTGIPASELPHIFDRFHRVAGAVGRTQEGTGIGLSLVRALTELHGGQVTVQSQLGRGTTFRVEIPKGHAHLPPDAIARAPAAPRAGRDVAAHAAELARWAGRPDPIAADQAPTGAPRPYVLVADDNADLREYIAGLLSPSYEVRAVADGCAALDSIRARKPDLLISDVMMPRLGGFALVRRLRADPDTAAVPVILLSAGAEEESALEGLDAGSDDYMVKPFRARELLVRVRARIEMARMRVLLHQSERLASLGLLSAGIAHEINNPLAFIGNNLRVLDRDLAGALAVLDAWEDARPALQALAPETARRAQERADQIDLPYVRDNLPQLIARTRDGVNRVSRIVQSLQGLARSERTALEAVRLEDVVATSLEMLRHRITERGITLEIDCSEAPKVRALASELGQVVLNLAVNAVQAIEAAAPAAGGRLRVTARRRADEVLLEVTDNGTGISEQDRPRLFDPFFTTKPVGSGMGLGLAISHSIVSGHGGRIEVESSPGAGSCFRVVLPIGAASQAPDDTG